MRCSGGLLRRIQSLRNTLSLKSLHGINENAKDFRTQVRDSTNPRTLLPGNYRVYYQDYEYVTIRSYLSSVNHTRLIHPDAQQRGSMSWRQGSNAHSEVLETYLTVFGPEQGAYIEPAPYSELSMIPIMYPPRARGDF